MPTHLLGLSPGTIHLPGLRRLQRGGESGDTSGWRLGVRGAYLGWDSIIR